MEIQVFGSKKSPDTRKALRFFAERRVKFHFVDFKERGPSLGELGRFVQKFGLDALVDDTSARYVELGLRHARLSADRWIELLCNEPLVLRMPLVRNGNRLTISLAETEWIEWVARSRLA